MWRINVQARRKYSVHSRQQVCTHRCEREICAKHVPVKAGSSLTSIEQIGICVQSQGQANGLKDNGVLRVVLVYVLGHIAACDDALEGAVQHAAVAGILGRWKVLQDSQTLHLDCHTKSLSDESRFVEARGLKEDVMLHIVFFVGTLSGCRCAYC